MKSPKLLALCFCLSFFFTSANKIVTTADLAWENPLSWQGSAVPGNPDTIIIRHYITFNTDLVISAPTILIIERAGTLCGDFLLDIACGAKLINDGYLYIRSAHVRDGHNFYEMYAKDLIKVLGCPPNGTGFFKNYPPEGHMMVWPGVLCKTKETQWPRQATGLINDTEEESALSLFPIPVSDHRLTLTLKGDFTVNLFDLSGRPLKNFVGRDELELDVKDLSEGVYFIAIRTENKTRNRRIVIK